MNFKDYFYYDETSPSFLRWKVSRFTGANYHIERVAKGDCAGSLSKRDGYWRAWLDGKSYLAHRIIMSISNGSSELVCDHIDGNRANNSLANLRYVTQLENARNVGMHVCNTSGVNGVGIGITHSGKYQNWTATVCFEGSKTGRLNKAFSINKFGERQAFEMACAWRKAMIEELNLQGAGYTETHGFRESHY